MRPAVRRLHTWSWVAIYLGLAAIGLGLAVRPNDDALGWAIFAVGVVAVAAGVVMIAVRARMRDPA